jgi:MFS family permease
MNQLRLYSAFMMFQKFGFSCTGFVYTTRLIEKFGFTNHQVMSLNFFYFASSLLLELPTGIIADRFGAKKSIAMGALYWFLGGIGYSLGNQYYHFLAAEIMCAIGAAFLSGALDSWLGGHFKSHDQFDDYRRILNQKIRLISLILTLLIGFLADKINLDVPYYIGSFMYFLSFGFTLLFDEKSENKQQSVPTFKESLKFYFHNTRLFSLGILSMSNMLWLAPVFMLWGPMIKQDMNLSVTWIGIASCILSIGLIVGGMIEHKLKYYLSKDKYLSEIIFQVIKGLSIVLVAMNVKSGIIIFLLAFFVMEVLQESSNQFQMLHVHKYYAGRADEATIASIHSLIGRIGGGLGNLCLGLFADMYGRQYSWIISGVMMIVTALIVLLVVNSIESTTASKE